MGGRWGEREQPAGIAGLDWTMGRTWKTAVDFMEAGVRSPQ